MDIKEENICRVCFKAVEDEFDEVNELMRKMFDVLLLKIKLEASRNPVICQSCAQITKKCFEFKLACIATEELILSYAAGGKATKLDIKSIYEDNVRNVDEGFNVCRFCMNRIETSNGVSLDALLDEAVFTEMLAAFMPGMDLGIIDNPIICVLCKENLQRYFHFAWSCFEIEEKVAKYMENEGTNSAGQISLNNLLQSSLKNASISEDFTRIIKKEDDSWEYIENEQIKIEEFDIKAEDQTSYRSKTSTTNSSDIEELTHNDASKFYKCESCTYRTKYKGNLKPHMLTHRDVSEIKMHKCDNCAYETKYITHLKRHLWKHKQPSEVPMYQCESCTYQSKYKDSLRRHAVKHKDPSQVTTYKCVECKYETTRKDTLRIHTTIHGEHAGKRKSRELSL